MVNRPKSFDLHPVPNFEPNLKVWYTLRPVGIHWIQGFWNEVMAEIGESGNFTPHSFQATGTTASALYHQQVPEKQIKEQTSHVSSATGAISKLVSDLNLADNNNGFLKILFNMFIQTTSFCYKFLFIWDQT